MNPRWRDPAWAPAPMIATNLPGASALLAPIAPRSGPALDPEALNNTNNMKLFVFGNEATQQARLVALLDNLGKGASGAAVQNLNIVLGLQESAGL